MWIDSWGLHSDLKFNQSNFLAIPTAFPKKSYNNAVSLSLFRFTGNASNANDLFTDTATMIVFMMKFSLNRHKMQQSRFAFSRVNEWNLLTKKKNQDFYSTSFNIFWLLKYSRSIRRKSQNVIPLPLSWLLKYPSVSIPFKNYKVSSTFSFLYIWWSF